MTGSIICNQLIKMYDIALLIKKEYTSEITKELYTQNYLMTSKFIPKKSIHCQLT